MKKRITILTIVLLFIGIVYFPMVNFFYVLTTMADVEHEPLPDHYSNTRRFSLREDMKIAEVDAIVTDWDARKGGGRRKFLLPMNYLYSKNPQYDDTVPKGKEFYPVTKITLNLVDDVDTIWEIRFDTSYSPKPVYIFNRHLKELYSLNGPFEHPLLPGTDPYEWSEEELKQLFYSNYLYPASFYREPVEQKRISYVRAFSVGYPKEFPRGELIADNSEDAQFWINQAAHMSEYPYYLIDSRETTMFYEFTAVDRNNPSDTSLKRIHRCSYLDRSMYSPDRTSDTLGVFIPRPFTTEAVKEVAEYLFYLDLLGVYREKVFSSYTEEHSDEFVHTFLYAFRVKGGSWAYEAIYLNELKLFIDRESGVITKTVKELHQFPSIDPKRSKPKLLRRD